MQDQAVTGVQDYILTAMPSVNAQIQAKCNEELSLVQALGFTEVAFNSMVVGSGMLGGRLAIRWPHDVKQLKQAKAMTGHDWYLLPAQKPLAKSPAAIYISGLKTANVLFDYLLTHFNEQIVDQILTQACDKGLETAAAKGLNVVKELKNQYDLISFKNWVKGMN